MTIFVHGIEFYAYHGCSDQEQQIGHRYVMDLEMQVRENSCRTDAVADTIDYGTAAQMGVQLATERQCRLVEVVASDVAEGLLSGFPLLDEVTVTLAKWAPPMPLVAESAGVVLTRSRK